MTWIPWPHISEIMLAASVTKQNPCWDNSTLVNLIRLNINLESADLTQLGLTHATWLAELHNLSWLFRHVKSRIINCLKILRMSHNPRGYPFLAEIARNRPKQDVGEPGCRAGRGYEMCPRCQPVALFFPDTLFEKSCLGTLAVLIPSNTLSHPSSTHS